MARCIWLTDEDEDAPALTTLKRRNIRFLRIVIVAGDLNSTAY